MSGIELIAVPELPMVQPGDSLPALITAAVRAAGMVLQEGDVVVIAQKIVSKAEGQLVNLRNVRPGEQALTLAPVVNKHPRHIEVVLRESREILWMSKNVLVVETHHGFVCANAGVDRSNIAQDALPPAFVAQQKVDAGAEIAHGPLDSLHDEWLALLPADLDSSARGIRAALAVDAGIHDLAVVINDTHGRPYRMGGVGVALGAAGLTALSDQRGESDLFGYTLQATLVATGDEIAAAASLLMGQAKEATPVVIVRGLAVRHEDEERGATPLIRPASHDYFRYPDLARWQHITKPVSL